MGRALFKRKKMQIGIYHDRDLDGLACAAIMKLRFPDIKLVGWDYSYNPEYFFDKYDLRGYEVYMADVSMPLEAMKMIAAEADGFVWIDHHEKAIAEIRPAMPDNTFVVYLPEKAACEIAWNWFFPDQETPEIISSLGAYNVWRKGDPERSWGNWILPIQMYYNAHWDHAVQFILHAIEPANRYDKGLILDCVSEGKAMMQFELSQIQRAMGSGKIEDIAVRDGSDWGVSKFSAFIINATVNPGRLADEVWREHPECEILIQYYRTKTGEWKYSLRSQNGGPNVAEIAAQYEGGGHPNAAGFVSWGLLW